MIPSRRRVESLARLEELAVELAACLQPGDAVALHGPMGAGKTTLVAALVRALHGDGAQTSSPTFTFWHRYEGTPPVNHLDFYRIEEPEELIETGLEEAFAPDALTLVEWPEHGEGLLPADTIHVRIAGAGDSPREVEIGRGG